MEPSRAIPVEVAESPARLSLVAVPPDSRLRELDLIRGIAVVAMVAFHGLIDLRIYGVGPGPWHVWPQALWSAAAFSIAGTFLFVAGVSSVVSRSRKPNGWRSQLYRTAKIGVLAGGVTGVSLVFMPTRPIYFGILHAIALSSLITWILGARVGLNLLLAALALVVGIYFYAHPLAWSWLLWLSPAYPLVPMGDYYPILPFSAATFLGAAIAKFRYVSQPSGGQATFESPGSRTLRLLGRHSLAIYLLHQPLLIALLYAFGLIRLA